MENNATFPYPGVIDWDGHILEFVEQFRFRPAKR